MAAKIDANTLLDLIPADKLAELSVETQVDKGVKKFTGHLFFKLLLFSLIKTDRISLRAIEHFYNSGSFRFSAVVGVRTNTSGYSIHINPLIPPSVVGGDARGVRNVWFSHKSKT